MTGEGRMMTALFRNVHDAEEAYRDLLGRGFRQDEISVVTSEETRARYFSNTATTEMTTENTATKAIEGSGVGAVIGGALGAIIGALAAIGTSLLIPGLGLIIAGPLAAALVGAGAGGTTGGIIGALVGSGIPEKTASGYDAGLREGGIILGFIPRSDEEAAQVQRVWEAHNAEMIYW
jgi:hypothetical protein